MEYKVLTNGIKMPMEGFGVFQVRDKEECKESVLNAIRAGYRLIDTAASYTNEDAVGEAVREAIAEGICGCTDKVVISFLDCYGKTKRNMRGIPLELPDEETMKRTGERFVKTAEKYGMTVESCAETVDLSEVGVRHGSCVDPAMIERILGVPVRMKKDKNQRPECGCVESVETGAYDTCLCGCKYCYANDSEGAVMRRREEYDVDSPLLCGRVEEGDRITVRRTSRILTGE